MTNFCSRLKRCRWTTIAHFTSKRLNKGLAGLAKLESRFPLSFLVVPLFITVSLSFGLGYLKELAEDQNALELYIPDEGMSKAAKKRIHAEFGDIYLSQLDPINGVTFSLIRNRKDMRNILRADFIADYLWLRNVLEAIKVKDPIDGNEYTYSQLCWKNRGWGGNCIPDLLILLTNNGIEGYKQIFNFKFPDALVPVPPEMSAIPTTIKYRLPLGGVTVTNDSFVREAKAVMMNFHFPFPVNRPTTQLWERQFIKVLTNWPESEIYEMSWFTMRQFQNDLDSIAQSLRELIPYVLLVITVVCVASCCVADWVHSKPWLAIAGVLTALMAMASGFGLLLLIRVPIIDIVYVAPFLILSIGVDDTFLMLASWRRTRVQLEVCQRMALTFSDAAVSITITSVTDILSLSIGAFCAFPAVRQFCLYTAVCLLFTYLYQITFFGACMVLSGKREQQNRHCLFLFRLPNSQDAKSRGLLYKVFCTGGDGKLGDDCCCDATSSIDGTLTYKSAPSTVGATCVISPKDNMFNIFFKRYYAPLLRCKAVKIMAGISYVGYVIMAVYGATTVRIGMNYAELLPNGVSTSKYLHKAGDFFTDHLTPMEVLLPALNYTNADDRTRALELAQKLDDTFYTGPVDFWLLELISYVHSRSGELHTENQFFYWLDRFLSDHRFAHYRAHIIFVSNVQLGPTRFLTNVHNVHYGKENSFQSLVRNILKQTTLNATAYHGTFQLGEQQAEVLPATLQTVGAATLAMLLISFLLIPKVACSVCLAACIISTNVGVLGAMSLWGVRLDIVSMITILMSIGISVDFVAHISYFYVQALELNIPASKAQRALQYLGLPIVQGAFSTVMGMLVLFFIPAYIVRAFVKTMLLVILFGLYHGLLLLPIVLALFIRDETPKKFSFKYDKSSHPRDRNDNIDISSYQNGRVTEISDYSCPQHKGENRAPTMSTIITPDILPSPNPQQLGDVKLPTNTLRRLWLRTMSARFAMLALKVQRLQQAGRITPNVDAPSTAPRVKVISWLMRSPSPTVHYYNSFDRLPPEDLKPTSVNAYPS